MISERKYMKVTEKYLKKLHKNLALSAKAGFCDGLKGEMQKIPDISEYSVCHQGEKELFSAAIGLLAALYKYSFEKAQKRGVEKETV